MHCESLSKCIKFYFFRKLESLKMHKIIFFPILDFTSKIRSGQVTLNTGTYIVLFGLS